ncbi:MAG: chromosomal replication initiator protein DnaA [Bacteroides sp.]|nr:chromosomal replication initiator protein DnaA [Bacillota bacterium]MCM1393727.1 chromosomal replication initiator protein DnaA [[Eubacterium] siraeum]MCM1455245.1 chromosomal replication initiator protein DnaA [Bacteroides sp.]
MINIEEFWEDAKDGLSISIQAISFEVWIDTLKPVCFVDNAMVLETISANAKRTIDNKYLDTIKEVVKNLNSSITDVVVILPSQRDEYLEKQTVFINNEGFVTKEPPAQKNKKKCPFLEKYSFENFVEGKSNAFALAACKTVAEDPGKKFNPLFIYSGVGLGKTHLLHAIGNLIYKQSPHLNVLYASAETLVTELISVIRNKSNDENNRFREKYRSCDVLMIDDIQFLIGKDATQEAFFHIFNDLYHENKQIIITSDRSPKDLTTLEDRLRTRFSWGLTVDIQVPDMETRVAILKNKAAQMKFDLSNEVAEFIAENATSNIRELEGLLNKIVFFSSLTNNVINTRELASEALSDFIEEKKETLDASDIIASVCKYYKITTDDIFSKKRTKNLVEPRMIAIYLITDLLSLPLVQIGEIFGGRDYTTIIHARDKITDEIKSNPRIRITVADIKNMLLNR